ncbi:helix-turn-helix domain-containing protein [Enterococcus faecalis]|uniref:helix-turn-helix domain-containing protein n=1 Tax=Enterococcus faecalis TaxID=1351 RepID=UPI000CF1E339|nr:S24 family peptidase [Enterococcus faecalis]EGO7718000.1 helix-turn-helix domain-containing protein [Enterococcus faecalis]EGO8266635.1 helix-turn-helix domain-containing protein [Enterococcus faecalis]EGO8315255.1 helix-turn-helix domain-containing protein [Enterococcus faecalis]EGQ7432216.1 helix-turn-helix domain-containing protein [Enterococcus faecalis]EKE4891577.1 helix-turn-helix domain-containing protein [Enterococcus faecalis]
MTIGEKMKLRRKQLKISADEIASALGVSRSTIFRYEKGEIEKLPTESLRIIAEVLKTTPEELMGWTENKSNFSIVSVFNQLSPSRQQKVYDFAENQLEEQKQEIKQKNNPITSLEQFRKKKEEETIYGTTKWYGAVSAGTGEFLTDETCEEIELPVKQIPDEADFCLSVNGDSMEPIFHDNDYVFVKRQSEIYSGNIGVVIVNGESFLKRIWFENNFVRLESFNKKYKDIIITENDEFRIVGKVVM